MHYAYLSEDLLRPSSLRTSVRLSPGWPSFGATGLVAAERPSGAFTLNAPSFSPMTVESLVALVSDGWEPFSRQSDRPPPSPLSN